MIITRFGDFHTWEEYARYLDEKCKASEAEIVELRSEKGLTGIIRASVNFASENIELKKTIQQQKEEIEKLNGELVSLAGLAVKCSCNIFN